MSDNKEYLLNEDIICPSASIIKVCILWTLFDQANRNDLDLEEVVILKEKDMVGGCGRLKEEKEGSSFTLREIARLMIILSDNTATNILLDKLSIDIINTTITELGLKNTILARKMMDFRARQKGIDNYTSAKDMKILLEKILDSDEMPKKYRDEMIDIMKDQRLNGRIPALLPEKVIFAHKTGELEDVEHDIGVLFLKNKEIIIISMLSNIDNEYEAKNIHNIIGKIVYDHFAN